MTEKIYQHILYHETIHSEILFLLNFQMKPIADKQAQDNLDSI